MTLRIAIGSVANLWNLYFFNHRIITLPHLIRLNLSCRWILSCRAFNLFVVADGDKGLARMCRRKGDWEKRRRVNRYQKALSVIANS